MSYQLKENVDYTIEFDSDLTSIGKKQIIIKATKDSAYIGQFISSYILYPIINESQFEWMPNNRFKYTSKEIKPINFKIQFKGKDVDSSLYKTEYSDNINKGTGKVKVENRYDSSDFIEKDFIIYYSLENSTILDLLSGYEYTGNEIKPTIRVQFFNKDLNKGTDYTLEYPSDMINVGTKTIYVNPGSSKTYEDQKSAIYKITQADIDKATVDGIAQSYTYCKKPIEIDTLEVKYKRRTLEKGTDYDCTYEDNLNAGKATITINGKKNFKDSKQVEFNIVKADISNATVDGIKDYEYTGEEIKQENLIVKLDNMTLDEYVDYYAEYSDNKEVGEAKIKIVGVGNFKNELTGLKFNITKRSIANTTIIGLDEEYEYEGKEIKPEFKLIYNDDYELVLDQDYTREYKNCDKAGIAIIEVIGKDSFSGTNSFNYSIVSYTRIKLLDNTIYKINDLKYIKSQTLTLRDNNYYWRTFFDFNPPYDSIKLNDVIGISSSYITKINDALRSDQYPYRNALYNIITVDLPQLKNIGNAALARCNKLSTLKIPNVQTLNKFCFYQDDSLNEVSCPKCTEIGVSAFQNCENLESVYLDNCIKLENNAFQNCQRLKIVQMSCLTSIQSNVFDNTGLDNLSIDSIEQIDSYGITNNTNLTSITFKNFTRFNGQFGIYENKNLIGDKIILGTNGRIEKADKKIKYVILDNSTKPGCKNLAGIIINSSIDIKNIIGLNLDIIIDYDITIDNDVFSRLENIKDFTSSKTKAIGDCVFQDSISLSSIQLSNVEDIGNSVIEGCKKLQDLDISKVINIGCLVSGADYSGWYDYYESTVLQHPYNIMRANDNLKKLFDDEYAFEDLNATQINNIKSKLNSLNTSIKEMKTSIAAFKTFQSLKTNINTIVSTISSKMTTIKSNANALSSYLMSLEDIHFYTIECIELESIIDDIEQFQGSSIYPDADKDQYIKTITEGQNDSYVIKSIKMNDVQKVGDRAFYGLHNLELNDKNIQNIKVIGSKSFAYCTSLTTLKLNNVLSCEYDAFDRCCNLKDIQMNKLEAITVNGYPDPL